MWVEQTVRSVLERDPITKYWWSVIFVGLFEVLREMLLVGEDTYVVGCDAM